MLFNCWMNNQDCLRITPGYSTGALRTISGKEVRKKIKSGYFLFWDTSFVNKQWKTQKNIEWDWQLAWDRRDYREARCQSPPQAVSAFKPPSVEKATALCSKRKSFKIAQLTRGFKDICGCCELLDFKSEFFTAGHLDWQWIVEKMN